MNGHLSGTNDVEGYNNVYMQMRNVAAIKLRANHVLSLLRETLVWLSLSFLRISMRKILFTFTILLKRIIHNGKVIPTFSISNSLTVWVSSNYKRRGNLDWNILLTIPGHSELYTEKFPRRNEMSIFSICRIWCWKAYELCVLLFFPLQSIGGWLTFQFQIKWLLIL